MGARKAIFIQSKFFKLIECGKRKHKIFDVGSVCVCLANVNGLW